MGIRALIAIGLLLFVAASVVYLFVGGTAPSEIEEPAVAVVDNGPANRIVAYYFHGERRCPTCEKLEAYANEAITTGFAEAIQAGTLEFRSVNYDDPANEHFVDDFGLTHQSIVIIDMTNGEQTSWENLERIWDLVGDKPAYIEYVRNGIKGHLDAL